MRAALVRAAGEKPEYQEIADPVPAPGEVSVSVAAAALSQLTRARASGTHYSSNGRFPLVPGVDGVGRVADGSRVYFVLPRSPHGAMAERTVVPAAQVIPVPEGVDGVTAAAIANPGMSSWAALRERARLAAGETVLINGATGASGRLAVQIARHMGAGRVIVTGRNAAVLETLGADVMIRLNEDGTELDRRFAEQFAARIDVVVDYLWGDSAERLLLAAAEAGPKERPIRFVQVGTASGRDITLPGALLRSSALMLLGSGFGSVAMAGLLAAIGGVFDAAAVGALRMKANAMPLADVASNWERSGDRTVFIPGLGD